MNKITLKKNVSSSKKTSANATVTKIKEINFQIGKTLQLFRKVSGISQGEMGQILGVHQAAVSRIEHGTQNLSADQLFLLTRYFSVRPDEVITGEVDYWALAERFSQKPPFTEQYNLFPFSRVREILPFLKFASLSKGENYSQELLQRMGVQPALLKGPDQKIGSIFELDLLRSLIQDQVIHPKNLEKVAHFGKSAQIQGLLHSVYLNQKSSLDIVHTWIKNSDFYESNFSYTIEEMRGQTLELSIAPNPHMHQLNYRDEILGDVLCLHRKNYLTQLSHYDSKYKPVVLTEKECHFHGNKKCVYKIKTAV